MLSYLQLQAWLRTRKLKWVNDPYFTTFGEQLYYKVIRMRLEIKRKRDPL